MITVKWNLASGEQGVAELEGDAKWTFGRGASDAFTLGTADPDISRSALVIRDSAPGPVVFCGQRDNGSRVGVRTGAGQTIWLDEGTAHNLSADAHRIEFYHGEELTLTADVEFDQRASVIERRHNA